MATVSMTEGARLVGRSKGTLSKALKSGKLSYVEKTDNGYIIDVAELTRAFPMKPTGPVEPIRIETPVPSNEDKALRVEVEMLRQQLEDLRGDRDAWRDQAQRLLIEHQAAQDEAPAQPSTERRSFFSAFRRRP